MPHRTQVIAFLREHPGCFCDDCLADLLGLPGKEVTFTTLAIGDGKTFDGTFAVCSRCSRRTWTVRAMSSSMLA
jgi:hypothetical protein